MNRSENIAENTSRESGFSKHSGTNYSIVMNLKGHSKLYWDSNEPETRLVGTIPLWIHYHGVNLIPSVPFSYGRFTILPTTNKPLPIPCTAMYVHFGKRAVARQQAVLAV